MKKISLFLLALALVSGSSFAQWSQVPAAWTEIQIAPGDITGVTITTTSPITGGSACTTGACAFTLGLGVVPATLGGTGQSAFTIGDVLYASSTTAISKLGIGTAGQCLVVTAGLPAWGTCAAGGTGITSIDALTAAAQLFARTNDTNVTLTLGTSGLDTHTFTLGWTGTLDVSRGGTALASGTSGGILGYTASGTLASSVALTANALVLGGGAGATPTPMGSLGTTTTVLHGNAAGAPTFGAIVNADITNATIDLTTKVIGALPVANGGTGIATTTAYSPVFSGTTATGTWSATTGPGTSGQVLTSNGAGAYPTWQAAGGGGSAPFSDATAIVKNAADATKLWKVDASGITTGNTVTMTPPIATGSYTGARKDAAQTFTGVQTFTAPTAPGAGGVGSEAWGGSSLAAGGFGTAVGFAATAPGNNCVAVGVSATCAGESVSLGGNSSSTGTYNVAIGKAATAAGLASTSVGAGAHAGGNYSIALGFGAASTIAAPANTMIVGFDAGPISAVYVGGDHTSATPTTVTFNAGGGLGTNIIGADFIVAGGKSTGNAMPGRVITKGTPLGGSTGTTLQTPVTRVVTNATMTGLSTGTATALVDIPLAASPSSGGGQILYTIRATDGTEEQSCSGMVTFSARRTGGGPTYAGTTTVVGESCTGSSGALSTAWAFTSGTNKTTLKVTPTITTITATTVEITYELHSQGRSDSAVIPF